MSQERADKYRRKAEEYRLKAVKAPRDYDKAAWLKLAEDWQQLADTVPSPRAPEETRRAGDRPRLHATLRARQPAPHPVTKG